MYGRGNHWLRRESVRNSERRSDLAIEQADATIYVVEWKELSARLMCMRVKLKRKRSSTEYCWLISDKCGCAWKPECKSG